MNTTDNNKTWQEEEIEDLLKIVRDAEKFKGLSKRLDEFEPQDEMDQYRDKGLG
jgi:hypothetical protein|tara:strand:- start:80 stop:241 length:162 start_codon:yes stop_codon:yes gene_type:complete